jgi:vitamin B12 transporter
VPSFGLITMSIHRKRQRTPMAALRLLVLVLPLSAAAQSRLDPVTITATREPQALSRSNADVVVIDAQAIRNSTADSVEDLLRRAAGVQLARNGGPGQPSGYFVRGTSTSSTVVLVDGVRIGSATLGQADFEALSLSQIERIEVLRGPASSLYGADAVGGVIQIFTRRGEGVPRITGAAAIGGYSSLQGDLGVSGSQGSFDYAVSIAGEKSDGVSALRPGDAFGAFNPDDDGFSRKSGSLRLGWAPAAGHRLGVSLLETRLEAQYDSAEFDADFNPDPSPDFRNRLKTRVAALDYRGAITGSWTATLQLGHSIDDAKSGGTTTTRFQTEREQATWQNALTIAPDHQLVLAYEHLNERASGDAFAGTPKRHNNALVAGYSGRIDAIGIQADMRHDDNSAYGGNTTGRVGLSFEPVPGLKLRALAGTSFRAPTFNDLFYPDYGIPPGTPGFEIKPEEGRSFEIGASWESGATRMSVTAYRNKVKDLIGYEPNVDENFEPLGLCPPGYPFGCARNIGRARLQGLSIAASQRWGALELAANVELLDATDTDTGNRLNRRAAHQESVVLTWSEDAWNAGAAFVFVGSRPDGSPGTSFVLGGYGVLDLRASWRFLPQWRLEAKLLNALDRRVEPLRDYQGLGRQAWLGVRFDGQGL